MNYFSGISFVNGFHTPRCRAWVNKHFEGYWVVNFAAAGRVPYQLDDEPMRVLQGPIAWVTYPGPRFRFGYEHGDGEWDHRFVAFRGPRVAEFLDSGLFPGATRPVIPIRRPAPMVKVYDVLIPWIIAGEPDARCVHLLEDLLLQLHEQPVAAVSKPENVDLAALVERVRAQPELPWDFADEAEHLCISPVHFRRLFRQLTGHPPGQFLQRQRLLMATTLLRDSTLPIKAIAKQVGIPDVYYFTRLFRQRYQQPPGAWRRWSGF